MPNARETQWSSANHRLQLMVLFSSDRSQITSHFFRMLHSFQVSKKKSFVFSAIQLNIIYNLNGCNSELVLKKYLHCISFLENESFIYILFKANLLSTVAHKFRNTHSDIFAERNFLLQQKRDFFAGHIFYTKNTINIIFRRRKKRFYIREQSVEINKTRIISITIPTIVCVRGMRSAIHLFVITLNLNKIFSV